MFREQQQAQSLKGSCNMTATVHFTTGSNRGRTEQPPADLEWLLTVGIWSRARRLPLQVPLPEPCSRAGSQSALLWLWYFQKPEGKLFCCYLRIQGWEKAPDWSSRVTVGSVHL